MSKPKTPEDYFRQNVTLLEGDIVHQDTQDITTTPYGIALHVPENKEWADRTRLNYGAGRLEDIPKEVYMERAVELFSRNKRLIPPKDYNNMTAQEQYVVLSAMYNTGDGYPTLAKNFPKLRGSKNPHVDGSLYGVYHNTRRQEKAEDGKTKKHTKGLDNRALKELYTGGFYDPYNEEDRKVAKLALPLAEPSLINSAFPNL